MVGRRLGSTALFASWIAFGCTSDTPSTVRVELDLGDEHLSTRGVLSVSDEPGLDDLARQEGDLVLNADFETDSGRLALLEMAIGQGGATLIRYAELDRGDVVFEGDVVDQNVSLRRIGDTTMLEGQFAFTSTAAGESRVVRNGVVIPENEAAQVLVTPSMPAVIPQHPRPDPDPPGGGNTTTTVIIHDIPPVGDSGCDDSPPPPDTDSGGCDDSSSSSSGGCDDGASSSGGGCDSTASSGGGCEGDTASSAASGCDSCEGAATAATLDPAPVVRRRSNVAAGLFRLVWPIALVAWLNRRLRRQLRLRRR